VEKLHIEQIRPDLTLHLRQEVLYPNESLNAMKMEEDANGLHFGVFADDRLVAVVSLFQTGNIFQFRKFAVAPHMQGHGIGKALLLYIVNFAKAQGGLRIWCNARSTAVEFYRKAGFVTTGKTFSKQGFDYETFEKVL